MKKIILLASLAFSISAFAQVSSYVPTSGLQGWWTMSGNANDQSGNSNNGVINGATLTTDRFGNSNSAYSFNGTSDFIEVTHNSTLTFTTGVSFSFWLNIPDSSLNTIGLPERQPIGKQVSPTVSGIGFETTDATAPALAPQFYVQGGAQYEDNSNLTMNVWHHLVGTYDGTTLKLYKNGSLIGTNTGSFSLSTITENLFFGKQGAFGNYFKGKLDDIRIYNRDISDCEVDSLFNESNSMSTGIFEMQNSNSFKVFPNPTNNHITIENGNISNLIGYHLKIINSLGQQVFQSAITQQQFYVDLSTCTGNGIYFVHIIDGQGNTIDIKKIILQ
jgi:hypothetical protein